jgi:hypothetical protein
MKVQTWDGYLRDRGLTVRASQVNAEEVGPMLRDAVKELSDARAELAELKAIAPLVKANNRISELEQAVRDLRAALHACEYDNDAGYDVLLARTAHLVAEEKP